jgi:hypothetical protein
MKQLIQLFRYVRPVKLDLDRFEIITQPTGGITFFFEIDQDNELLTFVPVICRDDDNFNYKISKDIATGRFKKGQLTVIEYERNLSLVDNVVSFLSEGTYNDDQTLTLTSKLNSILANNTAEELLHRKIIAQVNAKHSDTLKEFASSDLSDDQHFWLTRLLGCE